MSDDQQEYSIENQKAAIQEYAAKYAFVIVKTYADPGKSGVIAKNRKGLNELLRDVASGNAGYQAILVYDVSRWGRYPNNDEAAYYEFLCARSGIPLHYCAEMFKNDGSAVSTLLKAVKRSMAAEYSRELGEKVLRGKTRLVEKGFRVGGPAGYGYRRLMISADGTPKQRMKHGEHKSFTTDRVILVRGPNKEREGIKQIFSMAIQRMGCAGIARELNRRGFRKEGKLWTNTTVFNAVTNPKYMGDNVWRRTTQRLRTGRVPLEPKQWVSKIGVYEAIVDRQTFELAQKRLPKISDYRWTDEEILKNLRRLLKHKGYLSDRLLVQTKNAPSLDTIRKHFGGLRQVYGLIGYRINEEDFAHYEQSSRTQQLRERVTDEIRSLFPEHVSVTYIAHTHRRALLVDNALIVSLMMYRSKWREGLHWVIEPCAAARDCVTLVCKMNLNHDDVISLHMFSRLKFRSHRSYENDPWFATGIQLTKLSDFCSAAKRLWLERASISTPACG